MKWSVILILFAVSVCHALDQTYKWYSSEAKINEEFRNIFLNAQGKQFTIYETTPTLKNLQEGEIVIISSGTPYKALMFRADNEIYSIELSCVTVHR